MSDNPRSSPSLSPAPILLVEDEPTIAVTLHDDLVDDGYEVTCLDDGAQALRLVSARPLGFVAVIADLRLPGADGLRVLAEARRRWPSSRLLLITAHAGPSQRELLAAYGGSLLEKPFANGEVLRWLRGA